MIAFVPAYDEATHANLRAVGTHLPANALVGPDAHRDRLIAVLRLELDTPLAIWSHGTHDGPLGDQGQSALLAGDVAELPSRPAYVYACRTGTSFGGIAARAGWTWWGYTGAVSAPGGTDAELALMGHAFRDVLNFFLTTHATVVQPSQLDEVQRIVDRFEEQLDQIVNSAWENYLCLLHLRSRLRVWRPGAVAPIAPFDSSPLFLD
jgi:hypothetical protein